MCVIIRCTWGVHGVSVHTPLHSGAHYMINPNGPAKPPASPHMSRILWSLHQSKWTGHWDLVCFFNYYLKQLNFWPQIKGLGSLDLIEISCFGVVSLGSFDPHLPLICGPQVGPSSCLSRCLTQEYSSLYINAYIYLYISSNLGCFCITKLVMLPNLRNKVCQSEG